MGGGGPALRPVAKNEDRRAGAFRAQFQSPARRKAVKRLFRPQLHNDGPGGVAGDDFFCGPEQFLFARHTHGDDAPRIKTKRGEPKTIKLSKLLQVVVKS